MDGAWDKQTPSARRGYADAAGLINKVLAAGSVPAEPYEALLNPPSRDRAK